VTEKKKLVVGISGASGATLGVSILKVLKSLPDWESHLVLTHSAELTISYELNQTMETVLSLADVVHPINDVAASISSGSFKTEGMIIAPCSMKTVAGIACGYSDNLLLRAADVVIKERRKLVLLPRESPISTIHLRNLLTLSELGAIVVSPVPAFYQHPKSIDDVINHIVGRTLSYFDIEKDMYKPWTGQ
jgi:polyprenyl P-hydroxybenzoate and phenylacrylic acid decarboxylases